MKSNKPYNDTTEPYDEKLPEGTDSGPIKDPDMLCGIGRFKPSFLQVFARIGAFVGIYSATGLLTSTLTVYVNSQVSMLEKQFEFSNAQTGLLMAYDYIDYPCGVIFDPVSMLEKQFGFSSAQTGLLMAFNDIGYLCCVVFAGYIARKVHIPRGLGISTILYGVCGVMCSMPFFLQDRSLYALSASSATENGTFTRRGGQIPMCDTLNSSLDDKSDSCSITDDSAEALYNLEKLWIKKIAYALIAIGMVFQGVGKSTRYPFVTLYIDDSVDKRKTGFYMGILTGTGIFGPALAYLLGGLFSKIYVTLEDVDITPSDPRWIGAWWLGFLVFGSFAVVFSIPLMCFPRRMRAKPATELGNIKKTNRTEKRRTTALLEEVKGFFSAVLRVLGNPVYTAITLSSCLNIIGVAGILSFIPKYFASQYSIPLWKANMILAVSNIMSVSLGSFLGGLLTRKIKMTPINTAKMLMLFYVCNISTMFFGYFLGCDQPTLVGTSSDRMVSSLYTKIDDNHGTSCSCSDSQYFPICGDDGRSYFSPCHAGCSVQNKMFFSNCTSIPSGQATSGLCDQGCEAKLYSYAAITFIGSMFAALKIVPTFIAKIRCVDEKDRGISTALSGFLISTIGWMPGPVIFGRVIDGTCTLWKYICGERQSCMLYDIVFFRNALHTYGIVARTLGFLVIVVLYIVFRIKKTEQWREDKPMTMEKIVNGEKHVESKVYKQLASTD